MLILTVESPFSVSLFEVLLHLIFNFFYHSPVISVLSSVHLGFLKFIVGIHCSPEMYEITILL